MDSSVSRERRNLVSAHVPSRFKHILPKSLCLHWKFNWPERNLVTRPVSLELQCTWKPLQVKLKVYQRAKRLSSPLNILSPPHYPGFIYLTVWGSFIMAPYILTSYQTRCCTKMAYMNILFYLLYLHVCLCSYILAVEEGSQNVLIHIELFRINLFSLPFR